MSGCGDVPIVSGAEVGHKSFEGLRSTRTGDCVYFTCLNSDYEPFPPGTELVYCKADGRWTTLPVCMPVRRRDTVQRQLGAPETYPPSYATRLLQCHTIPVVRFGQEISRRFASFENNVAQPGDSIRFGCMNGYKIRDIDTAVCSPDGIWEPIPHCDKGWFFSFIFIIIFFLLL